MIRLQTWGSLPERDKTLGPAVHGHAALVLEAISYMQRVMLADALAQDLKMAQEGSVPPEGWPERVEYS